MSNFTNPTTLLDVPLAEPVDEATAIILWVFCGLHTIIAYSCAIILFRNRKSRLVEARTPFLLILSTCYGPFTQWLSVPSYIFGKNEITCDLVSIAYLLYLPMFVMPYQLMFPSIVFGSWINDVKRERTEEGKISWKWKLQRFLTLRFKIFFLVASLIIQIVVFLCFRYYLVLRGGENGLESLGQEVNCFRNAVASFAVTMIVYYCASSFLSMRALMVQDPFYVRSELWGITGFYAPFLIMSLTYPFVPQAYPGNFDYRWIPMVSTMGAFLIAVVPVTILSFPEMEAKFEERIWRFKNWSRKRVEDRESSTNSTIFMLNQKVDVFQAVLENAILLEAFTQYTVKDWSVENVLFYKEVENFEGDYDKLPEGCRIERAKKLVSEFVALQSPLEINIDYGMRMNLIMLVQEGNVTQDAFKQAKKHIFELMKKDSFEKWQRTQEYKNVIKESLGKPTSSADTTHSKKEQRKSALIAQASNASILGEFRDTF